MILVAGATGTLGTEVVRRLADRGEPVRVLTRDPARAAHLPETVEILAGDLRDPATIASRSWALIAASSRSITTAGPRLPRSMMPPP